MNDQKERFGIVKDALWNRIEHGLKDKMSDPEFWLDNKVELDIDDWVLTLDSFLVSNTPHMRIRAAFESKESFIFKVFRKGFFSTALKLFDMQDIEVGNPDFDRDFIIQGNDISKVKTIFSNRLIQELMTELPSLVIQLKEDEGCFSEKYPKGVNELYMEAASTVKSTEELQPLFALFGLVLNYLCHTDPSYSKDPTLI